MVASLKFCFYLALKNFNEKSKTMKTVYRIIKSFHFHTHAHPFNGPFSGTTRESWYQKGETNLDFTEARDSAWQWHQLGHMQVCTSLQTDNHASTPPVSLQAGCPFRCPTNSVKAMKAFHFHTVYKCELTKNR